MYDAVNEDMCMYTIASHDVRGANTPGVWRYRSLVHNSFSTLVVHSGMLNLNLSGVSDESPLLDDHAVHKLLSSYLLVVQLSLSRSPPSLWLYIYVYSTEPPSHPEAKTYLQHTLYMHVHVYK